MRSNKMLGVALAVSLTGASLLSAEAGKKAAAQPAKAMDARQRSAHALNRLTFGPRPGEVESVQAMGVEKWIESQLNPSRVDDSALQSRLKDFSTLRMDAREMMEAFPPPQMIRAVAEGRMPMPSSKSQRAIYEAQISAYRARKAAGAEAGEDAMPPAGEGMEPARGNRREAREAVSRVLQMPSGQRMDAVLAMSVEQRRAFGRALSQQERESLFASLSAEERQTLLAMTLPPGAVVAAELQQAKLLRAIYSERQLEEVMVDFWFNHFNVFAGKGPERYLLTSYERDVIRPHALGNFRELLMATAQSPAMLFYLDNWQSVGPGSRAAQFGNRARARQAEEPMMNEGGRRRQQAGARIPSGLNENYARELLELHTLGVNGGYTQKDVTEGARVFTGWTLQQPRRGGDYRFEERMHEPGDKMVLGQKFSAGGEGEGKRVLEMLARHPATARFISRKLAMRFVSDDPPEALVARMAEAFARSQGDIRQVLRVLFAAPEFWAADSYRAKVKTPLEFVASAVRATGAEVDHALALSQALNRMGMPLYMQQPPTGYSMKAESWVSTSALLNRMNFALGLAAGRLPGITQGGGEQAALRPASEKSAIDAAAARLLAGDISEATRASIAKRLQEPQASGGNQAAVLTGLMLGSPEFQRR